MKKAALKNFGIFTGKWYFFKNRLPNRCFPVNTAKLTENTYLEEHLLTAASDFLKQLQNSRNQLLLH